MSGCILPLLSDFGNGHGVFHYHFSRKKVYLGDLPPYSYIILASHYSCRSERQEIFFLTVKYLYCVVAEVTEIM